jgi:hypothetical protein
MESQESVILWLSHFPFTSNKFNAYCANPFLLAEQYAING